MICKWLRDFFKIEIPDLEEPINNVTFFTQHGGWTVFTFDDNKRYYHGEIAEPESFEGYDAYYIRWIDESPTPKKEIEKFIYNQWKKEWQ